MKTQLGSAFLAFVFVAILVSACAPASTSEPSATPPSPLPPTTTPEPSATMPAPTATLEPTAPPTAVPAPQQWNGTYTYQSGRIQNISLVIEKVDGATFTGKMVWSSFGSGKGAILRMNGEFITDFGTGDELTKWSNLEDYKNGDTQGTWLKWTETEILDGRNYTVNGWYYAHIREDGTMVAVYFFNDRELVADNGKFILKQVLP